MICSEAKFVLFLFIILIILLSPLFSSSNRLAISLFLRKHVSNSNGVLSINRVLSRTNSNSLLNAKNYSSHNMSEEPEGVISSSSVVNNLNLNSTNNGKYFKRKIYYYKNL